MDHLEDVSSWCACYPNLLVHAYLHIMFFLSPPLAGMRESVLQAGTYTSSSFRAVNASFWWRRHRVRRFLLRACVFFCVCGLKRQLPQHFNLPAHRLIKLVIDCLLASVLEVSRQTATDMTSLGGVPGVLHLENPSRDARRRLVIGDRCAQNLTFRSRNTEFRPFVQNTNESLVGRQERVSVPAVTAVHLEYVGQKALGAGPGAHPRAAETCACVERESTIQHTGNSSGVELFNGDTTGGSSGESFSALRSGRRRVRAGCPGNWRA